MPPPRPSAPPGDAPSPLNFSINEPIAVRGLSPVLSSASSLSISAASSTSATLKPSSVEDRTAASLSSPGPRVDVAVDEDALLSSRTRLPSSFCPAELRLPADSGRLVLTTGPLGADHRSAPLPISDAWPRGRASDARGMVHSADVLRVGAVPNFQKYTSTAVCPNVDFAHTRVACIRRRR